MLSALYTSATASDMMAIRAKTLEARQIEVKPREMRSRE